MAVGLYPYRRWRYIQIMILSLQSASEEEEGVHRTGSVFKSLGLPPLHSSFHQPRVSENSGQSTFTEVSHQHGRSFSRVHRPTAAAGKRLV